MSRTGAPIGLAGIRDSHGTYTVLACDHRDSLRQYLAPDAPDSLSAADLAQIKIDLARAITPLASGMLLDPEYGIEPVLDAGALAPGTGVVAALEAQGYLADPTTTITTVMEGWSAAQAAEAGASCAKVLLPYHPRQATASAQEAVLSEIMTSCRAVGLPLVVEPVAFVLEEGDDHTDVIIDTIGRLDPLMGEPDEAIFKMPFPGVGADHAGWGDACARVDAAASREWVTLSGGGDFDRFAAQVEVAMANGCSGFMVGRALWGEAARVTGAERDHLLHGLVTERFERLVEIAHR